MKTEPRWHVLTIEEKFAWQTKYIDKLEADVVRLRAQNKQHAEEWDKRLSALQAKYDQWLRARARAMEQMRGADVGFQVWSRPEDDPSMAWWRHTSIDARNRIIALVEQIMELEAKVPDGCPACTEQPHIGCEFAT